MKNKLLLFLTLTIIIAAAVFGISKQKARPNITAYENYLDNLLIAELSENNTISACKILERNLPDCPVILRVKPIGSLEHFPGLNRQKVTVQNIYKGKSLEVGQEIYIYSNYWTLTVSDGKIDTIGTGFVNIMKEDEEYLIFAEKQIEDLKDSIPVYQLYDETLISPVFSYEEHTNIIFPTSEDNTYVSYKDVKENEFFSTTEAGLMAWQELKKNMLISYPFHC